MITYSKVLIKCLLPILILGYALLITGITGGWPPNMPGNNGFYAKMAERLVHTTISDQFLSSKYEKKKRELSISDLFKRNLMIAGRKAVIGPIVLLVEYLLRFLALITGILLILLNIHARIIFSDNRITNLEDDKISKTCFCQ